VWSTAATPTCRRSASRCYPSRTRRHRAGAHRPALVAAVDVVQHPVDDPGRQGHQAGVAASWPMSFLPLDRLQAELCQAQTSRSPSACSSGPPRCMQMFKAGPPRARPGRQARRARGAHRRRPHRAAPQRPHLPGRHPRAFRQAPHWTTARRHARRVAPGAHRRGRPSRSSDRRAGLAPDRSCRPGMTAPGDPTSTCQPRPAGLSSSRRGRSGPRRARRRW
jgi:hypothetical protein